MLYRGVAEQALSFGFEARWFWLEIVLGLVVPLALLLTPDVEHAASGGCAALAPASSSVSRAEPAQRGRDHDEGPQLGKLPARVHRGADLGGRDGRDGAGVRLPGPVAADHTEPSLTPEPSPAPSGALRASDLVTSPGGSSTRLAFFLAFSVALNLVLTVLLVSQLLVVRDEVRALPDKLVTKDDVAALARCRSSRSSTRAAPGADTDRRFAAAVGWERQAILDVLARMASHPGANIPPAEFESIQASPRCCNAPGAMRGQILSRLVLRHPAAGGHHPVGCSGCPR